MKRHKWANCIIPELAVLIFIFDETAVASPVSVRHLVVQKYISLEEMNVFIS